MALFFALLAQEVSEATMPGGALHSWRNWTLPVVAAAGGIAGAVAMYLLYINSQFEPVLARGLADRVAIDAVATYYVMKAILPRSGALPFALLLAHRDRHLWIAGRRPAPSGPADAGRRRGAGDRRRWSSPR